ncbi:MAG: carboxypeptidase regulatory-like domain-containing protein [Candidatus Eisenbacteria bacterium]|nr:carboxypeptidase regulatory-like domain-containing protein [Candidatus Eisenbacteria bacterium]
MLIVGAAPGPALDDRYHTFGETEAALAAVEAAYPSIAKLVTLGTTGTDALPIYALKISDNVADDEDEPVVLYNGVHHAEEVMGLETCLWMIDELTTGYGVNDTITGWVDDCEIWFIPLLNPDGHSVVTAGVDTTWRKNKRDNNDNGVFDLTYDGVDLNQNYDWNWSQGGSGTPANEYYRGPAPFSEPENRVIRDFCLAEKPVFAVNYHSPRSSDGDCVYYPWYWPGYGFAPDHAVIYNVAAGLASRTKTEAGVSYTAVYGFATSGRARNWQYGAVGTIGFDQEILSNLCQPAGARVDGICRKVARGARYLLDRTRGPGITGRVTDAGTGDPIVAEVKVVELASALLHPRTAEPLYGRYWRMLMPGTYTVQFSSPGYDTQTVSGVVVGAAGLTGVDCALEAWAGVPDHASLSPRITRVAPNPTGQGTAVEFSSPTTGPATVEIRTVGGRAVATLTADRAPGGFGRVLWDGRGADGARVASGVYLARLLTDAGTDEAKVVVTR